MLIFGLILLLIVILMSVSIGIEFNNLQGKHEAFFVIAGFRIKKLDLSVVEEEEKESSQSDDQEYDFSINLLRAMIENTTRVFDLFSLSDIKSFWKAFKIMLSNLNLKIHQFDLIIATPDPAVTGILYGSLSALEYSVYPLKNINVSADFESKKTSVKYHIQLTVCPIEVIYNSFRALSVLPLRKMFETYKMISELKLRYSEGPHHV